MNVVRSQLRPAGVARLVPSAESLRPDWKTAWPWLFWACWGAWLAVSDLRNDEVQPAVLRLLVGGALLGYMRPRTWWVWALALAAWVPAELILAPMLRITPLYPPNPGVWALPPLPALVGAFLGRSVARGVAARRSK